MNRPLYFFTDYGHAGPYVGLLHAAARRAGYVGPLVDLQHDAPRYSPQAAGLLLAALLPYIADGVLVAVVDPGVGGARDGLVLSLGNKQLVGPDNGLFAPLLAAADKIERIDWQPQQCSASFHGRDWFVPVGVALAHGMPVERSARSAQQCVGHAEPLDPGQIIYCDDFGNAMTGLRASALSPTEQLVVVGRVLPRVRTFSDVPVGEPLSYENSLGLMEIAVNQGSAVSLLDLQPSEPVHVIEC